MNVVFDDKVSLNPEFRQAISSILPEGLSPLVLDPIKGLLGTPHKDEGYVFITDLPTDVLGYHGTFFSNNQTVPQWFIIVLNQNDHGVAVIKEATIRYELQNCKVYFAPDIERFKSSVSDITQTKVLKSGKALLYSKHKDRKGYVSELGRLLFGEDSERYEIQNSLTHQNTDATILLLCGEEPSDFTDISIPDYMEPIFVVMQPESTIQQYMNPKTLISCLAETYKMTFERVQTRIYFISTRTENWFNDRKVGNEAVDDGILIWDKFGLPVSRENYTLKIIDQFITTQFTDGAKLRELLKRF